MLAGKARLEGHGEMLDRLALPGQEGHGGREMQAHWILPEDTLPWGAWLTTEDPGCDGGQGVSILSAPLEHVYLSILRHHPLPLPILLAVRAYQIQGLRA